MAVNTRQRTTKARRRRSTPEVERWPDLAPLYGVQYRRTGHAITFTEAERALAEELVAEAPHERRLVIARWTGIRRATT